MKLKHLSLLLLIGSTAAATAASTMVGDGVANPFVGGGAADGWSGVSVLGGTPINAATAAAAGTTDTQFNITDVSLYANPVRAAEASRHVIPLLLDSSETVVWVGPQLTPTAGGLNSFAVSSPTFDVATGSYTMAFWQWRDGFDDDASGVIEYTATGGGGMSQHNVDGLLGSGGVLAGNVFSAAGAGHGASNSATRDYHYENTVNFIPEPSAGVLAALAGLALIGRRRR